MRTATVEKIVPSAGGRTRISYIGDVDVKYYNHFGSFFEI